MAYPNLLREGQLGDLKTPNRVFMCPMTRFRVTEAGVPMAANIEYYAQRASAGLIVTEANHVSAMGRGLPRAAGLHSQPQIDGWRAVTEKVHALGGRIFAQLTHSGRLTHPALLPGSATPVAPSNVLCTNQRRIKESLDEGPSYVDAVPPRALDTGEVVEIVDEYKSAARNALAAGFDGVELHSASGNLSHQFLASCSNRRGDRYGGSTANRCRFTLDVINSLAEVHGAQRVGIKIAPTSSYNEIDASKSEIAETYDYLLGELGKLEIAYVHLQRPAPPYVIAGIDIDPLSFIRAHYPGTFIAAGEFDRQSGERAVTVGLCDFVGFGRRYISNPDLIERLRRDEVENAWNEDTLYAATPEGFTDYPTLASATLQS